jgi:hypothetical protein
VTHTTILIRHHDRQIPQAQLEARVPAHAQNDNLSVEVASFEQIFDRDEPLHLFNIDRHPTRLHQSPIRFCTGTPSSRRYPIHPDHVN